MSSPPLWVGMSVLTVNFGKFYARRVEKRRSSFFVNIYNYLRHDMSHRSLWTWIRKLLHATGALHFFHVTCSTSIPGSAFGAEMGQARRKRGLCAVHSVRAGIPAPRGRHNGKAPEWELRFVPHDLAVVTTKRENGVYPYEVKGPQALRISPSRCRDSPPQRGNGLTCRRCCSIADRCRPKMCSVVSCV